VIGGRGALTQGAIEDARRLFGEALLRAREGGDPELLARALRGLGDIATAQADSDQARLLYEEARAASDASGDDWNTAAILGSLANLALTESRWAEGHTLGMESATRFRAIGDRPGEAVSMLMVGVSALRLERRDEAQDALGRAAAVGGVDPEVLGGALEALAWLLAESGHAELSAESLGSADAVLETVGARRGAPEQAIRDEAMGRLGTLLSPAELKAALRRGRDTSPEDAIERCLASFA
jgi:tetratricopeptide (TPR) repeat protein